MRNAETKPSVHRADYTLEMGVWHATCRVCGHQVADTDRRRAAATYRRHIRQTTPPEPEVAVKA